MEESRKIKIASIAENQNGEKVIMIEFPYDLDTLFKVRSIPGRKHHAEQDCWSAPLNIQTINTLINWGFTLGDNLRSFLEHAKGRENKISQNNGIYGLKGILRPFQSIGVSEIENRKGRALLADEMGLGKTIQSLAWLQLHPEERPAIVVTQATLKINWAREAEKWLPNPNVQILSGQTAWKITGGILIINYDILVYWWEELRRIEPQVIITDECIFYKNNQARRTKAVKKLARGVPYFIALSGQPIENHPVEIYNAWKIIDPINCPDFWDFTKKYCNRRHTIFGWDFTGASNVPELHRILTSTIMIRRLKKDVLSELPDKVRSFIPIELTNRRDYEIAEKDFIAWIKQEKGEEAAERASNAEALTTIEGLKQLAVKGKIKQAIEWINDFLEVGHKLVVFAVHKSTIETLMNEFGKIAVKIDGSVSAAGRQKAIDMFQNNDEIRLFVGNIKAAGVGITLTAASNVAFLELPWTPGEVVQAEDRCHRIGQKDSVNIYYLLAKDTIDEKIARVLDRKRKVIDAILDGIETEDFNMLTELMKEYGVRRLITRNHE